MRFFEKDMTKIVSLIVFMCLVLAPSLVQADEEADLQRKIFMDKKKLAVLQNMQFTDQEKAAFWPVYDKYQDALFNINQRTAKLIISYAKAYQTLSDGQAQTIVREFLDIEKERVKLKDSSMKEFAKVLPPKKVFRYLQVENKLEAIARYELAKGIPLAK